MWSALRLSPDLPDFDGRVDGWSVKAEYLYVHLAASSLNISTLRFNGNTGTPTGPTALNFNNNLNIARFGVNYRF